MIPVKNIIIWISLISSNIFFITSEKSTRVIDICQNQNLLLGSIQNMAKMVDYEIFETVKLSCNFCNENDNFQQKSWYFKKRGLQKNYTEVTIDVNANENINKISLDLGHTLTIVNLTVEHSGIYSCQRHEQNKENIFTYVLDVIFSQFSMPKIGKLNEWNEYKRIKLNPINKNFEVLDLYPYSILKQYTLSFKVYTYWDDWSKCEICGRRNGIRRKLGKCRLHPIFQNKTTMVVNNNKTDYIMSYYLQDNYDISCMSIYFNLTFPDISKIVRNIPNYQAIESCEAVCISVEGEVIGRKNEYKYVMTKTIAENSHTTLICPEVSLESTIEWFKDKKILNYTYRNNMASSEEEPHITIDAFNSLYILHATKKEEAIYSCLVDGEKIQKFDIRVVSKSKILNEEFIRYSIYLGFVLSLTLTCYCTGICVAFRRRSSFVDPHRELK